MKQGTEVGIVVQLVLTWVYVILIKLELFYLEVSEFDQNLSIFYCNKLYLSEV